MPEKIRYSINIKIIITMLVLFAMTVVAVSMLNQRNLRNIYEKSLTENVLLTNSLIASMTDGDDMKYFVDMLRDQDESFKKRQYLFHIDRAELYRLVEAGASQTEKDAVIKRMEQFHSETTGFKSEDYWKIIDDLKKLKKASGAKYVYVFADTGVTDASGVMMYTYIFDAEDVGSYDSPESDGLGTAVRIIDGNGLDEVGEIFRTKKQMEKVFYYNEEPYGKLYTAYAPVLDSDGNVTAILGIDLEPSKMYRATSESMILFNVVFLTFAVIIILTIYIFLRSSVTKPLAELTEAARKLAEGDIYTPTPASALKQKNEIGTLAQVVQEMTGVYRSMILNRVILDTNPFTCVIFDEKLNVIDCNPKALEFYNFKSKEELNAGYRLMFESIVPEYQPDGKKSLTFIDRIDTLLEKEYFEFETWFNLSGRVVPLNTIMKLTEYNGKPAIVCYQIDLSVQREIQSDLEYRGSLLQAMSNLSDLLLTAEADNFEHTLQKAFELIGRAVSADRVYIWKNCTDEHGNVYMIQMYEWSHDAESQQGSERTVNIPYDEVMISWKETLFAGKCLNSAVKNLSKEEQKQLMPQGVVSLLIAPIFIQNKFWGFIGFDDCHKEREFTRTEENILRTVGYMVMVFSDMIQNEIAMTLIADRENALTTARTKSNFLANMSHEIRTPMNAILGMTELILHENASESVITCAADIKNACLGLLALINDILDISKIESGKLQIISSRYQTASMLTDVVSIIKIRADKKRIPFVVKIDAGLPYEMEGDEIRVKQILINLLNNAVKFTHEGQITLTVSGELTDDGRLMLKCSVTDTGIGIKPEDIDKLFVSFEQINTRKNRNIEGTGLGLSISKQLAEMMNGFISVESEYGAGSTFTAVIYQNAASGLPMTSLKNPKKNSVLIYENRKPYLKSVIYALESLGCRYKVCSNQSELYERLNEVEYDYILSSSLYANKTHSVASKKQPRAVIVALNGEDANIPLEKGIVPVSMPIHCLQIANIMNGGYNGRINNGAHADSAIIIAPDAKVLVVDDNAVNLKVASGLLRTYEIQADTAPSGKRAIELLKETETEYDLIFMDHMMPEMDGIDTTVAIRKLGGRLSEIPIIALTANAVSGAREMFKAEGLDDYLAKPIEMSKLNAILKKWIPKEKQQHKIHKAAGKDSSELEISGVDVEKGIERTGGTLENYKEILSIYVYDGEKTVKEIINCFEKKDFKNMTIYIHAMKSASANIGAEELSHAAAELESAGNNGDVGYIEKHIKFFTDTLSTILSNIRCYLDSDEKRTVAYNKTADFSSLKKALVKISENLENADIEAMEEILAGVSVYGWDENISSLLNKMSLCLKFFDYEGIENILAELENVLNKNNYK